MARRLRPWAAGLPMLVMVCEAVNARGEEVPAPPEPTTPVRYDEVIVTATPEPRALFGLAAPVTLLHGEALSREQKGTLGDTLATQPGVNATGFAPGASRPVVRGLDGDRVRILQNGVGVGDASQTSPDHAVSLDPATVKRIEVVRGPATLLYGPNAIGGVVNVIDGRVPEALPEQPVSGGIEGRGSSVDLGRSVSGTFEGGVGGVAYYASAFTRAANDVDVPGFARSRRLRAQDPLPAGEDEPYGTVPNSAVEAQGGTVGLSRVGSWGFLGIAPSTYATSYGAVADDEVTIDLTQRRLDVAGALEAPLPGLRRVRTRVGLTDYEHVELEGAEVGTRFETQAMDARLEVVHDAIGPVAGAVGMQSQRSDLSATGAEAFLPPTASQVFSGFLFEELDLSPVRLQLGMRLDHQNVDADADPRFGPSDSRRFVSPSGSIGAVYEPAPGWAMTSAVAYTQRAPNGQELFANGPHLATGAFEVGDRDLSPERALGIDVGVRRAVGRVTGAVNGFYNRFDDYIALEPTGRRDPDEDLPIYVYRNVPAQFAGFEAEGAVRVLERGIHQVDLSARADYVWAENRRDGEPLPRISPLRFGGGLAYQGGPASVRLDVLRVQSQRRHAREELTTDGYTMLDLTAGWDVPCGPATVTLLLRATNLLDVEARNAVSFLKDVAPLPGRGVLGGARVTF